MTRSKNVGASVPLVQRPARAGRSRPHQILGLLLLLIAGLQLPARAQEAAVVTFTLDFPGSEPSHYAISVSSDGHSTYDSDGKLSPDSEGDPFHLDFSMSAETRQRIFELAERAHYFQGEIDSKKKNLASTGSKTLTYKDSGEEYDSHLQLFSRGRGAADNAALPEPLPDAGIRPADCSISIVTRSWRSMRS